VKLGEVSVTVEAGGRVVVDTGNASYDLDTFYSYPGAPVSASTANQLSSEIAGGEAGWSPQIAQIAPTTIEVAAKGMSYSLLRCIHLLRDEQSYQIEFEDKLTNIRARPTGVFVHYALIAPQPFVFGPDSVVPGGAENPTMFLDAGNDQLGILVQDDVSRVRWGGSFSNNQADFQIGFAASSTSVSCIALDVGASYSIHWRLYVLPPHSNYFDFVNHIRSEWKTNFTIDGPFQFFDLAGDASTLQNPQELAAYLKRKRLRVVGLTPGLDGIPFGSFPNVLLRSDYKSRMQKAINALKAADPTIKCLGYVETDWVTIDPDILAQNIGFSSNNWTLQIYTDLLSSILNPTRNPPVTIGPDGASAFTQPNETQIIEKANLPWADSLWLQNGQLELFLFGSSPTLTVMRVYPAIVRGVLNYQRRFIFDNQIKFLLNDVGFDGFYVDDFSQSWESPTTSFHTYIGWDGISADIDSSVSEIVSPNGYYIDMGLAGRTARREICEYALNNGKTVVANTYPSSAADQPLRTNRFMETENVFSGKTDPFAVPLGHEPVLIPYLLRSSLASPIGLGINPGARVSFFGSSISVDGESVNNGETLTVVVGGHNLATTSGNFQGWNASGGAAVGGSMPQTTLTVTGNGSVSENSPAPPPPPNDPSTTDIAERVMRAVVDLLRHGMVYYYYGLRDIPATGTGSGEYGPINHMFPLTPIALHKGWIEGKERIITAIHGTYVSVPPETNPQPQVHCFDIRGRAITVPFSVSPLQTKLGPAWEVEVEIKDWAEIAVIEYGFDKSNLSA
jgi:hypothetical protein